MYCTVFAIHIHVRKLEELTILEKTKKMEREVSVYLPWSEDSTAEESLLLDFLTLHNTKLFSVFRLQHIRREQS